MLATGAAATDVRPKTAFVTVCHLHPSVASADPIRPSESVSLRSAPYIIFAALVINLTIAILQEGKASRAFDLLRNADKQYARVLRDGQQIEVAVEAVVPGDIVFLESGDKVPADIRILEHTNIRADESVLTGEWMPVTKDTVVLAGERPITEQVNR